MRDIRLSFVELRSLGFGAIGAAYMGIGVAFSRPYRMIHIQNLTNALMMFSFDGVNDHFPAPINGYLTLDITYNQNMKQGLYLQDGDRLYVKQVLIAPTMGSVYVSGFA